MKVCSGISITLFFFNNFPFSLFSQWIFWFECEYWELWFVSRFFFFGFPVNYGWRTSSRCVLPLVCISLQKCKHDFHFILLFLHNCQSMIIKCLVVGRKSHMLNVLPSLFSWSGKDAIFNSLTHQIVCWNCGFHSPWIWLFCQKQKRQIRHLFPWTHNKTLTIRLKCVEVWNE